MAKEKGRRGGFEGKERRNYEKTTGGEAKAKSFPVTPVSPMLTGLPVGANSVNYPS